MDVYDNGHGGELPTILDQLIHISGICCFIVSKVRSIDIDTQTVLGAIVATYRPKVLGIMDLGRVQATWQRLWRAEAIVSASRLGIGNASKCVYGARVDG